MIDAARAGAPPAPLLARALRGRYFYSALGLLVLVVVAVAFARPRVVANLLHPAEPRPWVLYVHIALSASWILMFLAQATLVAGRRVAWHRALGRVGIALGTLTVLAGLATAVATTRMHLQLDGEDGSAFLALLLFEMLAFGTLFGLAVAWRRRPEYHRRLMLMATCTMTWAAFLRFPAWLVPHHAVFAAVDALIAIAAARDWLVERRVHPVYRYGLPALVLGQVAATAIFVTAPPAWMAVAHALLR